MAAGTNIAATTAAVTNRYVTSTNMKVGAYTLANTTPVWQGGAFVTVTHTANTGTDTLGTIDVVGVDIAGNVRSESIVPLNGTVATGLIPFRTITSITGVGWVINGGNDTIVVGVAAGAIVCGTSGTLYGYVVNITAAATVVFSDAVRTLFTLPVSLAVGDYDLGQGIDFVGYLRVATTSTNDIVVVHSPTAPGG